MDNTQRERIGDDLRGVVRGELLWDDLSRVLYSTDASIFQVEPLGVVAPRDEDDVRAVVRYAGEHGIPLVARGAGTGMAGESLGSGIVLDLSRHFRSVLEIGTDTVRVQPGVIYRELSEQLARQGRRFAPDPASGNTCTVGGMLANNASGARAYRHGYTRDHVASLRVVLDNADAVAVGRQSRWPAAEQPPGRLEDIVFAAATLLEQKAGLIRECRPRTRFNRCGYLLHDVLTAEHVDLARLLVGSEGTLALFTEATLRTLPLPGGRSLVLLGFPSLDAAFKASQAALPTEPVACELIDRRLLSLARQWRTPGRSDQPAGNGAVAALVPPAAEAVLLIEYESNTPAEARRVATELADRLYRVERLALHALVACEPEEIERCWRVREVALPSLYGLRGQRQPIPLIEDVGVPSETLLTYLHRVQELLQHHEITASFLVHAATGQVHTRPFVDLTLPEEVARLRELADEVYSVALDLGGTISTQHGTGLARTPWVARQYGPLYPVFRDLKAIFDPRHLFNPGKIVGPDPDLPAWPLRQQANGRREVEGHREGEAPAEPAGPARGAGGSAGASPSQPKPPARQEPPPEDHAPLTALLRWQNGEMQTECATCNGCGHCRTEVAVQRMCPIFRADHGEAASPRAKANLMRFLFQPPTDPRLLASDAVREVADLCVNCKMCAQECPAHVNVPKLMLEAKAANVAEHGLRRGDWVLSRTESFAWLGSALAPITNAMLANPGARWLLEKLFGVSRRRRLPAFALRPFLHRARRRGWTRKPRGPAGTGLHRIAYFVDVFANYNDPLIGEAVVAILHHHGIEVYVPPGQRGCGMAPLAAGDVELARETLQHNLRILADLVREGFVVLCSEPTAALLFRHDARDLIDDPDVELVAEHTVEFTAYLADLHAAGRLRTDFRPLNFSVGHHVPCHLKALGRPPAGPGLLALVPQLRVHTIDVSCSGMAGTFGLKAENYDASLAAGRPMLEEVGRPRTLFGSTECSTCRMQMEDGAGKRTLHPAQYLALAYGLVPEIDRRLREPIGELVLR
jgi:FAD/FMN-containing dehydrogenase/Fe-S oxidoreductase